MKTIICGGRDYKFTPEDIMFLGDMAVSLPITEVVQGGASGADCEAKFWAIHSGIKTAEFRADWKAHGKAAGPMRNAQMARYGEFLIAFPGGRGTADMIRQAKARGLTVCVRNTTPSFPA